MMIWERNKLKDVIKKIDSGRFSEGKIASLGRLIENDPSTIPAITGSLAGILMSDKLKAYRPSIFALNMIADKDIELVSGSAEGIVNAISRGEKELQKDGMVTALILLFKITQKHPDKMGFAVPDLFNCMANTSKDIREKAYYVLALLSITTGYIADNQKKLVRALNGLHVDERIYACKLVMKIADRHPKIAEDTFDILDDIRQNHRDNKLRSEAAYVVERLRKTQDIPEEDEIEPHELFETDADDMKETLEYLGLGHLIAGDEDLGKGSE